MERKVIVNGYTWTLREMPDGTYSAYDERNIETYSPLFIGCEEWNEEIEACVKTIRAIKKEKDIKKSSAISDIAEKIDIDMNLPKAPYPVRLNIQIIVKLQEMNHKNGIVITQYINQAILEKLTREE